MFEIVIKKDGEEIFNKKSEDCTISSNREIQRVYGRTRCDWGSVTDLKPLPGSETSTITLKRFAKF